MPLINTDALSAELPSGDGVFLDKPNNSGVQKLGVTHHASGDLAKTIEKAEDKADDTAPAVMVVMDGPLSQIYTQALLKSFKTEGITPILARTVNAQTPAPARSSLYVYVTNDDANLVELHDSVAKASSEYDGVMVAVEHSGVIGPNAGLIKKIVDTYHASEAYIHATNQGPAKLSRVLAAAIEHMVVKL